ncbi:MAG: hypothetical protein MUE85_12010 [Microscillaceae bacterium]|jgi:hypothetical protein|nr:hypothetical protein [Microscillaceae bacterium]
MRNVIHKLYFWTIALIVGVFPACNNQSSEQVAPAMDVKFYKPESSSTEPQLQMTLKQEDYQLSTFGEFTNDLTPSKVEGFYVSDSKEKTEAMLLWDKENESNFIYNIDPNTGQKGKALIEFENISTGKFYLRIFHYDWQNRLGTLLFETLIEKQGNDYKTTPSFEIEDPNFGKSGSQKVNRAFPSPVLSLNKLLARRAEKSRNKDLGDLIDGFKNSIDDFRNGEMADFLASARRIGSRVALAGATLGLLGVKATTIAAGSTLLIGGAAVALTATAIQLVTSDRFKNFVNDMKTKLNDFKEGIVNGLNDKVEIFNGYRHNLREHWNNIRQNLSGDLNDLLKDLKNKDLLNLLNSLDDLPDSNGVLQFALSWQSTSDIDLYVTDPSGETIFFDNPQSASGGYLDRDDVDGFGPENIYFQTNIPDGTYSASVRYFGPAEGSPTPYTVSVGNGLGAVRSRSGVLAGKGDSQSVFTVIKSGTGIIIQ